MTVGATVVAASIAVASLIAVSGSTSSGPVLAFAPSTGLSSATGTSHGSGSSWLKSDPLGQTYRLVYLPALSSDAPSTDSFEVTLPGSMEAEASRLATALGVTGVATVTGPTEWQIGSPNGSASVALYEDSSSNLWRATYLGPAAACPAAGDSVFADQQAMTAAAQGFLSETGMPYTLGTITFQNTHLPGPICGQSSNVAGLFAPIVVSGDPTLNLDVSMAFNAAGQIVEAGFPDFLTSSNGVAIPLQSPQSAARALAAFESAAAAWESRWGSSTPIFTHGRGSGLRTVRPHPVEVRLTGVSIALVPSVLANGTHWLLPRYIFVGFTLRGHSPVVETVLAIDSHHVRRPVTRNGLRPGVPTPPIHP